MLDALFGFIWLYLALFSLSAWQFVYSKRHVYFMLAQLCCGLPSTVPGLNWHLDRPARAASSKRLKPDDFSTADSITLPSAPTKNLSCTVPSSSKRLEALGYSGFSQLEALMTAAVTTGGAGGAGGATGAGDGGATGWGVLDTAAMALTGDGADTATSTGGT